MTPLSERILAAVALLDEAQSRLSEAGRLDYDITGTARRPLMDAQAHLRDARRALTDQLGGAIARERLLR